MTANGRNAAIWYSADGFDPAKGINGRRVVGEALIKGFLRHAEVAEAVILSHNPADLGPLHALAKALRPGLPLRHASLARPASIAPLGTIFHSGPNIATEAWRRAPYGEAAWALSGMTHTTATAAVMKGFLDLRVAPTKPWDAVICTSQAVRASVAGQLDLIDDHLTQSLSARLPPRPMLPVIPLGVHCDDHRPDPAARAALRARLNAAEGDVIFATIARLTPFEKFDPLPVYLAMQAAQRQLPKGQRLHVLFCGVFRDAHSRDVFTQGAARLMPDVGFLILDGASAANRTATLSAADVYLFMIDNIQETFGVAPLEGMAAGLPMLVSDWDGMKDTVPPEVGFRVTTRTLGPAHMASEALRYHGGTDDYGQYLAAASALTEIDMGEMTRRILDLARQPDLRRQMGQAARARAGALYDWSKIIPQLQDLWAEQTRMRLAGALGARRYPAHLLPVAPSPTALFRAYPTEQAAFADLRFVATPLDGRSSLRDVLATRDYQRTKRMFASVEQITAILDLITADAGGSDLSRLSARSGMAPAYVERILIWLLKYDFIRRAGQAEPKVNP